MLPLGLSSLFFCGETIPLSLRAFLLVKQVILTAYPTLNRFSSAGPPLPLPPLTSRCPPSFFSLSRSFFQRSHPVSRFKNNSSPSIGLLCPRTSARRCSSFSPFLRGEFGLFRGSDPGAYVKVFWYNYCFPSFW